MVEEKVYTRKEQKIYSDKERILIIMNHNLAEKMDRLIMERHEWTTRQEFIREAIRRLIEKHKPQDMI